MKDYECKKCGEELLYELLPAGIRVLKEREDGTRYYPAYCQKCKEYFESEK